jgi:hypothetical protein
VKQRDVPRHHRDGGAQAVVSSANVMVVDHQLAPIDIQEALDQADQGRFARPEGPASPTRWPLSIFKLKPRSTRYPSE